MIKKKKTRDRNICKKKKRKRPMERDFISSASNPPPPRKYVTECSLSLSFYRLYDYLETFFFFFFLKPASVVYVRVCVCVKTLTLTRRSVFVVYIMCRRSIVSSFTRYIIIIIYTGARVAESCPFMDAVRVLFFFFLPPIHLPAYIYACAVRVGGEWWRRRWCALDFG